MWDLASAVPVAPVQPFDPASRINDHSDANYQQGLTQGSLNDRLVPLAPYTHRRVGDTADGVLLYDSRRSRPVRGLWNRLFCHTHTPLHTYSRFRPYLRR